ncbi:MAG: sulfite exporter TauE/SafE family protein [Spartobacteria bacterium]|nr:sulfite exporter TauE/SafE family protein [Spartobacteria bacterium]
MDYIFVSVISLVVLVTVCAVYIIRVYLKRKTSRLLAELTAMEGAQAAFQTGSMDLRVHLEYDGAAFDCTYTLPTKNAPPMLTVQCAVNSPASFSIRRINRYDRWMTRLKAVRPLQTANDDFDHRLWVTTDRRSPVSDLIMDPQIQQVLLNAFNEHGLSRCTLSNNKLRLVCPLKTNQAVTRAMAETLMDDAKKVSETWTHMPISILDVNNCGSIHGIHWYSGILGALAVAGGLSCVIGITLYPPLYASFITMADRMAPFAAALWCMGLFAGWISAKHRTDRHLWLTIGVLLGALAAGFIPGALFYVGNGYMDRSPMVSKPARVYSLFTKGKGAKRIQFSTQKGLTSDFDRPNRAYNIGDPVVLHCRSGYFGVTWLQTFE